MSRTQFLNLAGLVEGGTVLLALGLGWTFGVSPWNLMTWDISAVAVGLLATLPMFVGFTLFRGPRDQAAEILGDVLCRCRWDDLILVGLLAGFGEELLFRGVIQPWIALWSPLAALILTNLLFGVIHYVSLSYFLVVTLFGLYLSWLTFNVGEPNLLRAMVAHGVYDVIAFFLIVRQYRRKAENAEPLTDE